MVLAVIGVPIALALAVGGDVQPLSVQRAAAPAVVDPAPCCLQLVAADAAIAAPGGAVSVGFAPQASRASRWVVDTRSRFLPVGLAPEKGLQVKTILVSRAISAEFPQIHNMGGVRPDALRWHPEGLAVDVMIPNPGSAEGIALGNAIVEYVFKNAKRFGIQDAIWRGVYYTPSGPSGFGYGHYDHVHVTTLGGGYPTGNEVYYR
ncbi:hypothetical protein MANY_44840 [Mycolicibacterium anyangense]|uniref:ARB-07466-like C-terminal domain-containing protein n=2 Tax=Mycolicibacterium anyangense TaxID=1431246 RepID=A0A6N4WG29_9MYCO|nr:hypothetical protein MANY_44840 [Mycolicibacterium anyangense]